MPLTFFAHQVPVVPLKLWRPRWFDGLALCVGSMAPDFAYPLGSWLSSHSHQPVGVLVWSVPFTLVACALVRRRLAGSVFAQVPDAGPFRLHSYRVLAWRRPAFLQTLLSALLGAASHVVLDAFTHKGRFGSRLLGFDAHVFTAGPRDFTVAGCLQYLGHTVGSLVGLLLVLHIGRSRRLDAWYGRNAVAAARRFVLTRRERIRFWSIVAAGPVAGLLWSNRTDDSVIFTVIVATLVAAAVAGWSIAPRSARAGELHDAGLHQVGHAVAEAEPGHGEHAP